MKTSNKINERTACVIMPIRKGGTDEHAHFQSIYSDYIARVLRQNNFISIRADEISAPGNITKQIIDKIANAELVIADLTDLNPNVFYELGIRHTLAKIGTILLLDEHRTPIIPFDISPYRSVIYRGDTPAGLAALSKQLDASINEFIQRSVDHADNPVHDWLADSISRHFNSIIKKPAINHQGKEKTESSKLNGILIEPEELIEKAIQDCADGLLPREVLNSAHTAVRNQNLHGFLECVQKFSDAQGLSPSEREYAELYFLSNRMDEQDVSAAVLGMALRAYPESKTFEVTRITRLARSAAKSERQEAKNIIFKILQLDANSSMINIAGFIDIEKHADLLGVLLDTFHRDGEDNKALELTTDLLKHFPESTVVLRNHARALEKIKGSSTEAILDACRKSVVCPLPDDTSAIWYAKTLQDMGRLTDGLEALLHACNLDLDEARSFATVAHSCAELLQPQSVVKAKVNTRKTPDSFNEDFVRQAILLSYSCPNFAYEHRFTCETAMKTIGLITDDVQASLDERGQPTRRDRARFASEFYSALRSSVTYAGT